MNKLKTYNKWAEEQRNKALEFYKDPFTGEVEDENMISFLHKTHIGGSTNSAILGVNRYRNIAECYEDMINFNEPLDKFILKRGHYLEPFVSDCFSDITKLKHVNGGELYDDIHDRPWSMAQVDFFLKDGTPLEIKTATFNKNFDGDSKDFGKGCEFNDKGDLISEDDLIPIEYFIQCQKQMYMTNKPFMWLCVYIMTEVKVRIFKIKRDDKVIQKIIESEDDFLFNHVIPQIPYEKEQVKMLEHVEEGNVDAVYTDDEFNDLLSQYKEKTVLINDLKKEQSELGDKIKSMIGEHKEVIDTQGNVLAKLTVSTTNRFDTTAFKNAQPNLYKEYLTESSTTRLYVK